MVGTYSSGPTPVGWDEGTFGGDFTYGQGDVAADDLIFTSDVSVNGLYSASNGGPTVGHVVPPTPGCSSSQAWSGAK